MIKLEAEKIHRHLSKASHIVVVPHPDPDADAFGSTAALVEHLLETGRRVEVFCLTQANARLKNLPHTPEITNNKNIFSIPSVDTIVLLDCGDPQYAGVAEEISNHPAVVINIDHHATNENYGKHNLVLKNASATAEVLYYFFQHNRLTISRHMATNLLAGIVTDTGNFTNGATTPAALAVAGELVRRGANYKLINYFTQKDKTLNLLKLWGVALSRLEKIEEYNLVYTYLKQEDYKQFSLDESESGGISDFMNNINDANILLFLKETEEGKINGSFRTTDDHLDVSALAKKMGGGGHKKAAGFTADGTIESILKNILTLKEK